VSDTSTAPGFDWNADPESIAARAAELALEQHDRLRTHQQHRGKSGEAAIAFYSHPFEVQTTNKIASLLSAYAVLKGYVTLERAQNGW
jgi:hypothetical protein